MVLAYLSPIINTEHAFTYLTASSDKCLLESFVTVILKFLGWEKGME